MSRSTIEMYGNKVWGKEVSSYGIENGYLDYATLAEMVGDCILNNTVRAETMCDWEIISGTFDSAIFQDYIISEQGYKVLEELTDELVFYNEKLDLYIWAVDHYGTAWSHVLTDIKLIKEE